MTARRSAQQAEPGTSRGPERIGLPQCPFGCGFTGHAGPDASPYIFCGGDPTWHHRAPVAARFRTTPALTPPAPAATRPRPGAAVPPRPRRPAAPARPAVPGVRRRGTCRVCSCEYGLQYRGEPPVLSEHGPAGDRCPGSGEPPLAGTIRQLVGAR